MAGPKWTLLALPLLLGGCFISLPVTLASLSLNGAAYIDSGKTMPEHALSAATARDCSIFRAVNGGGRVCQDSVQGDAIMLASGPEDTAPAQVTLAPASNAIALGYPGCRPEQELGSPTTTWSQCVGLEH